jgi:hypothetical protein
MGASLQVDTGVCNLRAVTSVPCYAEIVPTPRTWLPRAEEILAILKKSSADELDRTAIEMLFEIQRRTALLLMDQVGVIKHGLRHSVSRTSLLSWVEQIVASEGQELERRQRVSAQISEDLAERRATRQALDEAGKPARSFAITREILSASVDSLPPGIEITPGRIVVSFNPTDPDTACRLLYQLGLALSNDFDSFLAVQQVGNTAGNTVGPTVGHTAV